MGMSGLRQPQFSACAGGSVGDVRFPSVDQLRTAATLSWGNSAVRIQLVGILYHRVDDIIRVRRGVQGGGLF